MGHYEHNSNWTRVFNQIGSGLCHSSEKENEWAKEKDAREQVQEFSTV
jgi:hypothetical protein